jgi:hypothetical protein
MESNIMKTLNDQLAEKIADLAKELLNLENNFEDNNDIKKRLSSARDNLYEAHFAIRRLDFNWIASNNNAKKREKDEPSQLLIA